MESLDQDLRREWLLLRRHGIGGSDIGAICGVSKWRSPVDVYLDKIGETPLEGKTSDAMHFGTVLEDIVAKEFTLRTGMKVQRVNRTAHDSANSWMIANIDRAVVNPKMGSRISYSKYDGGAFSLNTDTGLECKTANAFNTGEWGESQENAIKNGLDTDTPKIPIQYLYQCQWYMRVLPCLKQFFLAVLIGGSDFRIYRIKRDDALIEEMEEKARDFWTNHVQQQIPPAPVTAEEVKALSPVDDGEFIEADFTTELDVEELKNLNDQIKTLEEKAKALKDALILKIGERTGITIDGNKAVTYKAQNSSRFNTSAFKKDHPDLYTEYAKESTTRVFKIY